MVMTRMRPNIVQVNKLWEDMTGYTAAEVVGNSLVVTVSEKRQQAFCLK
jgi:PAS domain S-box-containing protein